MPVICRPTCNDDEIGVRVKGQGVVVSPIHWREMNWKRGEMSLAEESLGEMGGKRGGGGGRVR